MRSRSLRATGRPFARIIGTALLRTFYGPGTDDCTFAVSDDGKTLVLAGGGKVQVLDLLPAEPQ